jgi:hypothetical protein
VKPSQPRELKAGDLKAHADVIVRPPGVADLVPMRIASINPITQVVRFYSGQLGWSILIHYDKDGELYDEVGRRAYVYEVPDDPQR